MQSKFIPLHYIESAAGRKKLASALIKVTDEIGGASFMTPKGQAGIPPIQRERFNETALNPVILDTAGTLLVMFSLPWVSQLPPSPAVLKSLWGQCRGTAVHPCKAGPRGLNASVDQYVGYDPDKAQRLRALCDAGVGGNTSAALACLHEWQYKLIPDFQRKVDRARETLWEALPNEKDGKPFSGAYWSETVPATNVSLVLSTLTKRVVCVRRTTGSVTSCTPTGALRSTRSFWLSRTSTIRRACSCAGIAWAPRGGLRSPSSTAATRRCGSEIEDADEGALGRCEVNTPECSDGLRPLSDLRTRPCRYHLPVPPRRVAEAPGAGWRRRLAPSRSLQPRARSRRSRGPAPKGVRYSYLLSEPI